MSTLVRAKAALVLVALFSTMIAAGPTALASPQSGAQQSVGIVALRHAADGAQTRIILEGTAELPYTIYRPDERTILVDLPGVDATKLDDGYAVDSRGVERIQVERLRTASGQSLARLRIRLRSQVEDRTVIEGRNLILTLSAAALAPATSAPAAAPTTAPVVDAPATLRAEVPAAKPVATSALAPAKPAASVPENPATAITAVRTDVSNGTFRAFIATDGRVSFKHFLLPNPDRIVVDITGVKSSVERNAMEVNLGGISRIRVGQFRTADPKVVRIVFDVTKMGPYDVRQVGSDLVLSLGPGATAHIPTPAKSAPAPAPVKVAPETAPSTAPPVQKPLAPAARPAVSKPIVSDDEPADTPAAVKPVAKPVVKVPVPTTRDATRAPSATPVRPVSEELQPQNASGRPVNRGAAAAPRSAQAAPPGPVVPRASSADYMQEGFVGRPVNLELKNVDLRDVLRFLHNRFGVNFIVDKSVPVNVPVDVSLKDVPWNQALEAILKSQGLGLVREDGKMIRVSTLASIASEGDAQRKVQESYVNSLPLITKIFKLKYASPVNKNTQAGPGGGGGQSQASSPTFDPSSIRTGIYAFIKNRLSTRGRIEFDGRTNSVIVTDLSQRIEIIDEIVRALDRPEPQVEIEARIVIARRNFLRDLGVQISAGAANPSRGGFAGISSIPLLTTGATGGTTDTIPQSVGIPQLGGLLPSIPGGLFGAPQVLDGQTLVNLTTGIIGTFQISAVIYASEQKGQIRTVAAPRITTQNNTTAEVVNGVQIPVQTISNNTITTTYVDAALRLNITPQIIVEDGAVLLSVIAENNDVSTLRTVGGTPGINTQSATAVVLVPDGGTTVLGGINIDQENQAENRTPGLSRIPLFGNLFKRRSTNRDTQEILFFITPRIFRPELVGLTQESSLRSNDITITPVIVAGDGVTLVDRATGTGPGGTGDQVP